MLFFLVGIILLFTGIGLIIAYATSENKNKKQKEAMLGGGVAALVVGVAIVGYIMYTRKRMPGISTQNTNWIAPRFDYGGGGKYNVELDYVGGI